MDDRILHYIWLSNTLSPGSKTPKLLFEALGNIDKIFEADSDVYRSLGVSPSECARLCNKDLTLSESHYNYCRRERIGFLCYDDPYYPERLKIINNPPALFYYRGRLANIDDFPCFAFVGTRSCSEAGFRLAYETAFTTAARGGVIVNGLAGGIDGACIAAALDANAYAIGVLGCGIDRIYPPQNKDIFYRLSASGLILTEFAPFSEPKGSNFPVRNRVISGLCLASAVFEADAEKSGAMITARHALEQGRRIFAVPGKPYDKSYSGPLELIKDGATVLTEADDILSEFSLMFPHRINIKHAPTLPYPALEGYVEKYFKKRPQNPETPVSGRKRPYRNEKKSENQAEKKAVPASSESIRISPAEKENDIKESSVSQTVTGTPHDTSLLSATEKAIYEVFLEKNELTADEIVSHGIKIEDVLSSITLLEVYGFVTALPGGRYKLI